MARFDSFSALARGKTEGADYNIVVRESFRSAVSIVAPHGGAIEPMTSEIAQDIAGDDHSLYIFESAGQKYSFFELHVPSDAFDEPRCLSLVAKTKTTVTIHGCKGDMPVIYMGGRDAALKDALAAAFSAEGIAAVTEGHDYPGTSSRNICNRNENGAGVQLEFSRGMREDADLRKKCVEIVRACLPRF